MSERLDCIVIGYNEMPFIEYEKLLSQYGRDAEAYRDLQFSFVDVEGKKMDYMGLLNHVFDLAGASPADDQCKSCDLPDLAAVYLDHVLRKRGHNAVYIHLFQHDREDLARYLDQEPLCVGITTIFYVMN